MHEDLRRIEERRMAKIVALRDKIKKGVDSGPTEEVGVGELVGNAKARGRRRRAEDTAAK